MRLQPSPPGTEMTRCTGCGQYHRADHVFLIPRAKQPNLTRVACVHCIVWKKFPHISDELLETARQIILKGEVDVPEA